MDVDFLTKHLLDVPSSMSVSSTTSCSKAAMMEVVPKADFLHTNFGNRQGMENVGLSGFSAHIFMRLHSHCKCSLDQFGIAFIQNGLCLRSKLAVPPNYLPFFSISTASITTALIHFNPRFL
jgi:hypothetical protein